MTNELSKFQPEVSPQDIAQLTRGKAFLPQIAIVAGTSKVIGQQHMPPGRFYLKQKNPEDCIPLGTFGKDTDGIKKGIVELGIGVYRYHAMLFDDANNLLKESFNNKDTVWDEIKREADRKNKGASYGLDFLMFVPPHMLKFEEIENQAAANDLRKQFKDGATAIFFYKSTALQFAPHKVEPGTALRIKSTQIVKPTFSWWVPSEKEIIKDQTWFKPQALLSEASKFQQDVPEVIDKVPEGTISR